MSSYSPTRYFSQRSDIAERGFTLVEMLVSVAIIAVISIVSAFEFSRFDSGVLLKSLAYEIAVSLREAQTYSVSVIGQAGDFDNPYGMSFTPNSKQYMFFIDTDGDDPPEYDGVSERLNMFTIGRNMIVSDTCVVDTVGVETCGITPLDISFKRPELKALISAPGFSGTTTAARVKVSGGESLTDTWVIEITPFGQISVFAE